MPTDHVARQNAKRAAVRRALNRHKVFVSTMRFMGGGEMTARVIVDGEAYEVDGNQLKMLEAGKAPSDLALEPEPH